MILIHSVCSVRIEQITTQRKTAVVTIRHTEPHHST